MIWQFFYNWAVVPVMWCGFRLYALLNEKARRAWKGRKGQFRELERRVARLDPNKTRIWFHSSSLGEFEQAKPIIAELKRSRPDIQIIISFFSPSGYENSLKYQYADVITYIPFDSSANAKKFIHIISPSVAIFIRYDIWPNHLWVLKEKKIPVFIVSASVHKHRYNKLPVIGSFVRYIYNAIDYILTVSEEDKRSYGALRIDRPVIEIIGDTRYDQVWKRKTEVTRHGLIDPNITKGRKVIVVGSSWKEDEKVLFPAFQQLFAEVKELLVILVPHEPKEDNLEAIEKELGGRFSSIRFSHLQQYTGERIIIVDSVGILMALYQYGHLVYIGGGFGAGIHNVLEPAVYGLPVLCGPRITNSQEARLLQQAGALFEILFSEDIYNQCKLLLTDEEARLRCGASALEIVKRNVGATSRFLSYLEKVL
jgi:3-deoxy-D-manno-octulosonic-acid transferase